VSAVSLPYGGRWGDPAFACDYHRRLIQEPARAEYFEALCEATFRSPAGRETQAMRLLPVRGRLPHGPPLRTDLASQPASGRAE
jgi:hypothetical protein